VIEWQYALLGLAAGVLVGVSGVGGGSLVTPALTLFGIPVPMAVGTDLAFAAITKTFGAAVHRAQRSVDWRIAGLLAAGSCPSAALTVAWLSTTGVHAGSRLITATLAVALILTALSLCIERKAIARAALRVGGRLRPYRAPVTIVAGAGLGALVTLSSIGAARSAPCSSSCSIRACRRCASPGPTSRMPCRSHSLPAAGTSGSARWT
jgi:hypothetical protein